MARLLALALTLLSLDTGQSADLQWRPLCGRDNDDGGASGRGQLFMDAEIVARIETEAGLSVLVNNKQRDVSVKCLTPGKLSQLSYKLSLSSVSLQGTGGRRGPMSPKYGIDKTQSSGNLMRQ